MTPLTWGERRPRGDLNQNPGISGMTDDLDMIHFDLPRDTENGVTRLDEQVEDHEVPVEIIEEIN